MRTLQRLHDWVVWSEARAAYVVLFVFALIPFFIAPAIGTWESFDSTDCKGVGVVKWKGLQDRHNWWIWPFMLPLSLWMLRLGARRMFGKEAAIMSVVESKDRSLARERLDEAGHDIRATVGVLLLMLLVIIPAEFASVGAAYLNDACPKEKDWTVFFLAGRVPRAMNLLHVVPAYIGQYIVGYFGILTFVLFFRHNWMYLRWVYQRHRRKRSYPIIELKFDDRVNCCFGQLPMRGAFNLQVWVLVATGLGIVVSRAINVSPAATAKFAKELQSTTEKSLSPGSLLAILGDLTDVEWHAIYPDPGQIVLVVLFVLVFLFVSMPSLVKFLPFRAGKLREGGAKRYLAEFIPPGSPDDPDRLKDDGILKLAEKFRHNSFWPAGDNTARRLFLLFFAVLLFVLMPVPMWDAGSAIVYFTMLAILAVALTAAAFAIYRWVLGWVADILVKEPGK